MVPLEQARQEGGVAVAPRDLAPPRAWRIGIDAIWAGDGPTGTGVYTLELVRALVRRDPRNTYYLYFGQRCPENNALWQLDAPNVVRRVVPVRSNNLRTQV